MTNWFEETLHDGIALRLSMDKVLFRETTDMQDLVIFENTAFGRVLALDGIVQTTEGDEFVYHEMMSHVPLFAHGAAADVLIIGGGDGGMAREVLKHRDVATVTMVEIDAKVVDVCQRYLPAISAGAFDDPRMRLKIDDGAKFVQQAQDRWDVIIIDSTDPIGPGTILFGEHFYSDCKRCLTPGGILVTQNGVPAMQGQEVTDSSRRLFRHFADVWFYLAPVPTYHGGSMAFGWATDNPDHRRTSVDRIGERFRGARLQTRYYSPEVHVAAFALPVFIRALID